MWRIEKVNSADEQHTPVNAKAALIDPGSMTVLWMNESASQIFSDRDSGALPGVPIEQVIPMAKTLGVPEALRAVANTGVAQHLQVNVVSTSKGSMAIVASIYRLPDGKLLMLMDHDWHARRRTMGGGASRRSGGRAS